MECKFTSIKNWLLAVEYGLLMLLTVVILLVGIPSYIDVGTAVRISYYFLSPVLAILFLLLVGIVVIHLRKQGSKKPKLNLSRLLLLLVVFVLPLILSFKIIQHHKSSWKLLSKAWIELDGLNQTELLSSWQEKGNCCGVMGPYDYLRKGLELPKNCFNYKESEVKVKDGCYKVFRDNAFITYYIIVVIIVVIFAVYLMVKIARNFLEWKADMDNSRAKRRTSNAPLL
ncbi:uncharacterized protein [Drosophila kikkawai]|uniref:Uncharacterized protein n=1 Tax=Drosophila kikkawai TaxID=30033 RepID=A0A6P4ISG7_DROKI|nr:uncharacterized protein LOC108081311 [Drosophila kikkawai]